MSDSVWNEDKYVLTPSKWIDIVLSSKTLCGGLEFRILWKQKGLFECLRSDTDAGNEKIFKTYLENTLA